MRTIGLLVLAILTLAARGAGATSGTCTITSMSQDVLREIGLHFGIPVAEGLAMPVEFDEASGTFSMSRDAWYAQFGEGGAAFFVGFGMTHGFLRMGPGTTVGTIERNGTVSMPNFPMDSATDFEGPCPCSILPLVGMGLGTGVSSCTVNEGGDSTRGVPLDFATGTLTLSGCGVIGSAPGASGSLINAINIKCTLSPIPAQASLPEAPSVTKVAGKAQTGSTSDKLTLKAAITGGATPLAFATAENAIVNLIVDGAPSPVAQIRVASFTPKGKKLTAVRDDTCKIKKSLTTGVCKRNGSACTSAADCGSNDVLELLKGRKGDAPIVGSVVVTPKAKATTLSLNVSGLDLSTLTGPVTFEVWVGGRGATGTATASGTTKKKIK